MLGVTPDLESNGRYDMEEDLRDEFWIYEASGRLAE